MKTIVIGDVHGCFNELKKLIEIVSYEENYKSDIDKIVFLGDYIDRGENSMAVIKYIREMQKDNQNVIAIMGNHEDMIIDYIDHGQPSWLYNGYRDTIESYDGIESMLDDIEWMRKLPLYFEDDDFIYVHAGIDPKESMEEQDRDTLLWVRDKFIGSVIESEKKVIFGHTPTTYVTGDSKPFKTISGNIDIDTGCVYDGALTALVIEDGNVKTFYQVSKGE